VTAGSNSFGVAYFHRARLQESEEIMEELSSAQISQESIPEYAAEISDPNWQEQMVLQYAPLIKYIASRLALRLPSHISMEDLISSGIIGLIDAVQKFDPAKNISFKTYAEFRIKGAMLDELRSLDWIPRSVRKKTHLIEDAYAQLQKELGRPAEAEEVAAFLDLELEEFYQLLDETKTVSLVALEEARKSVGGHGGYLERGVLETIQDDNARDSILAVQCAELQEFMVRAIDGLPDKEKLLISLYYYEELTMKEIGQIMGYTESRISQLHTQAMYRLKHKLREYSHDV
jgi:RNA polymerase sigma factor FliA